jgi:cytochrome c oxidase subunit 2
MALAVVVVLLVIGSVYFHFASPWYFTELASNWSTVDFTVDVTFWVTGIAFVIVNLFSAYCLIRYRHRKGRKAHYEPESHKIEIWLTVGTGIGVAAMLIPGLFVWAEFVAVPADAMRYEAVGKQWHWSYRFPGADGEFGRTSVRLMTPGNPLGLDPEDAVGMDDVIVADPIVHLPVGTPIRALLRSTDVLHNFTVPQFRVKMDLVPGMVTYQWFTPTVPGTYEVLCEELCGVGHFAMRGKVVVDEPAAFEQWLAGKPTFAQTRERPVGNAAVGAATYAVCAACHGQQGEGNVTLNAPKLAGLDAWYIRRQIANYQNGVRGADPGDIFGVQMAPMARTLVNAEAVENVLAHIATLPDTPPAETVLGDAARGRAAFTTCAVCHGRAADGRWGTNAPRLAGMSDWYLARQLGNFRARIRGGHEADIYGDQMHMLAASLKDERAINDVVAYINTLQ